MFLFINRLGKISFQNWLDFPTYIPNDRSLKPRTSLSEMQVATPSTFYPPHFHRLGFGWHL
jgi:hypothetical protein